MVLDIISSVHNMAVKKMKALATKKGRSHFGEFIVEGEKYVWDIPDDWMVENFFVSETYFNENDVNRLFSRAQTYVLKDNVFQIISDTVAPQGILAAVKQKTFILDNLIYTNAPFFVIAENLQDPGNLGTLIRTADAAGADGVILSDGCVDAYNPKVVRATAGSLFHIPILEMSIAEAVNALKQSNIKIIAAHLRGKTTPYAIDLKQGVAIITGNESKGLTDETTSLCDYIIKLPMAGKAESLNASVASGIFMYEVLRQRLK